MSLWSKVAAFWANTDRQERVFITLVIGLFITGNRGWKFLGWLLGHLRRPLGRLGRWLDLRLTIAVRANELLYQRLAAEPGRAVAYTVLLFTRAGFWVVALLVVASQKALLASDSFAGTVLTAFWLYAAVNLLCTFQKLSGFGSSLTGDLLWSTKKAARQESGLDLSSEEERLREEEVRLHRAKLPAGATPAEVEAHMRVLRRCECSHRLREHESDEPFKCTASECKCTGVHLAEESRLTAASR